MSSIAVTVVLLYCLLTDKLIHLFTTRWA